jgi:hypothetical protein
VLSDGLLDVALTGGNADENLVFLRAGVTAGGRCCNTTGRGGCAGRTGGLEECTSIESLRVIV